MHRTDDDETAFGRPVYAVAVLLFDGLDMLEIADAGAFDLFGAEE